jgi:hypothetical protein
MIREDIQLDNNAIAIVDNDVVWGNSDEQHIVDTINSYPGWWKENPSDGVGIFSYLKSRGTEQFLAKSIKLQLQSDGYIVTNPVVLFGSDGRITINPNASR